MASASLALAMPACHSAADRPRTSAAKTAAAFATGPRYLRRSFFRRYTADGGPASMTSCLRNCPISASSGSAPTSSS
ncbi:MAG: hypothetical protein ACE5F1_05260 [Planctomycetota bacterium]